MMMGDDNDAADDDDHVHGDDGPSSSIIFHLHPSPFFIVQPHPACIRMHACCGHWSQI